MEESVLMSAIVEVNKTDSELDKENSKAFRDFERTLRQSGYGDVERPFVPFLPFLGKNFYHDHIIETSERGNAPGVTYEINLLGKTKRFNNSGQYDGQTLTITFNKASVTTESFSGRVVIRNDIKPMSDNLSSNGIEKDSIIFHKTGPERKTYEGKDRYANAAKGVALWMKENG